MRIPDYAVSQFLGLNTAIRDLKTLKPGVASDSKNWVTGRFGDHIELRRGSALLGNTRQDGLGKITSLGVGIRYDGLQVPIFTHGKKIRYYDATADDTAEVKDRNGNGDLLGNDADGEDVWISPYQNLAGSFAYIGSPHASVWKVPAANPGSAVDQLVTDFRFGHLRFGQGRSIAVRRSGTTAGNQDQTGVYLSNIDHALLGDYDQTTDEAFGTGDSATTTFTHTLTVLPTTAKTAMYVSVTDTNETFTDDRNGGMIGNKGGTGTVDYATGVVSVTFATAPANLQAITCSYYTEDATDGGTLDFDTSETGAGKPKIFRQDDGGPAMCVLPFMDVEYCFHLLKTWALTTTIDDTSATNLSYRLIGAPYPWAACETPEGILCIDVSSPNEPKVRRLQIQQNTSNTTIVPQSISDALDLSAHAFDYGLAFRWGDYEIVCCADYVNGTANTYNSVMYLHNVVSGAWDKLDYRATRLTIANGALLAGDPLSNNVFTLFSGFDDDESPIDNHWQDGQLDLGTKNLKRAHYMRVTGLIQKDQAIDVLLTLDDGEASKVFTIEGDGAYVDSGISTPIGSYTLGSKVIGGGGEATAHPFDVTFPIHTDIFQHISTGFEATGIGYGAINLYMFKDIRDKGTRSLPTKTV